jgi:hypothetical protein
MTLLRVNSRVWALSTLGLAILGALALRGVAQMDALWVAAMLVAIGGSILAWHAISSVARSGHTEADRLERAGKIAAALTVLEADVGFKGIQRLMKRRFRGGDAKLYRGIEKDFLEIARLALAVKNASSAAARLGVPRDLTDAYWHRADSISRPTWRRFEVIATAREQGFQPPVLSHALNSTHGTLAVHARAKSLRDQVAEDALSLKRMGDELVAETTRLATTVGDDYADATWWKNYLEANRELHSEDRGWSARQARGASRLPGASAGLGSPQGAVGNKTAAAAPGIRELGHHRVLRTLFFLGLFLAARSRRTSSLSAYSLDRLIRL